MLIICVSDSLSLCLSAGRQHPYQVAVGWSEWVYCFGQEANHTHQRTKNTVQSSIRPLSTYTCDIHPTLSENSHHLNSFYHFWCSQPRLLVTVCVYGCVFVRSCLADISSNQCLFEVLYPAATDGEAVLFVPLLFIFYSFSLDCFIFTRLFKTKHCLCAAWQWRAICGKYLWAYFSRSLWIKSRSDRQWWIVVSLTVCYTNSGYCFVSVCEQIGKFV